MFLTRRSTKGGQNGQQNSSSDILPTPPMPPTPPIQEPAYNQDGTGSSLLDSEYAAYCKRLMALDADLRGLGVGGNDLSWPRVVVIGGQSTGKSSLVEAVSGINVPRDAGTCTRCPMECTMSSVAESWSCIIEIYIRFDKTGPEIEGARTQAFSPIITDKSEVELWIRRAQAAILSPHRSPKNFAQMGVDELKLNAISDERMLPFSRNSVYVRVNDPDATDLSFVDLPGLVQNMEQDIIDLIRGLVKEYIAPRDALILITMPMSDDIENQGAVLLAKEVDPAGDRTIGIVTKPNTLSKGASGSRKTWSEIIQGTKHRTKHGYYTVCLPDDEERQRGISRAESQALSEKFFESESPWKEMTDRSRFGIPNIVKDVSDLLVQLIQRHLPRFRRKVDGELGKCLGRLKDIPPPPKIDPSTEILLRISGFCKDFQQAVFGEDFKHFVQASRRIYGKYKTDIQSTAPNFFSHGLPTKMLALTVEDVRKVIDESIGWQFPDHVPFDAIKVLVRQSTKEWPPPSHNCLNDIISNCVSVLNTLINKRFGQYPALEDFIRILVDQERHRCVKETQIFLNKVLKTETSDPVFTQNFDVLKEEENKWVKYCSISCQCGYQHNNCHASHHSEKSVMAKVLAYFQVAHKRIIDTVPLLIEHELNQSFAMGLEKVLFASIPRDPTDLNSLVEEDPVKAKLRAVLVDRKERLLKIIGSLDEFGTHAQLDFTIDQSEPPTPRMPPKPFWDDADEGPEDFAPSSNTAKDLGCFESAGDEAGPVDFALSKNDAIDLGYFKSAGDEAPPTTFASPSFLGESWSPGFTPTIIEPSGTSIFGASGGKKKKKKGI